MAEEKKLPRISLAVELLGRHAEEHDNWEFDEVVAQPNRFVVVALFNRGDEYPASHRAYARFRHDALHTFAGVAWKKIQDKKITLANGTIVLYMSYEHDEEIATQCRGCSDVHIFRG